MVLRFRCIAEHLDAGLTTNEATEDGSATEHTPLHGLELTTAEMGSNTRAAHNDSCSAHAGEAHSKTEGAPATLSFKEIILAEKESVGSLNDIVGGVVSLSVVIPA